MISANNPRVPQQQQTSSERHIRPWHVATGGAILLFIGFCMVSYLSKKWWWVAGPIIVAGFHLIRESNKWKGRDMWIERKDVIEKRAEAYSSQHVSGYRLFLALMLIFLLLGLLAYIGII